MIRSWLLPLTALLALTTATTCTSLNSTILYRDVAVIGGGASGTYAAIRLQEEGKTVALLEKQNRLGGVYPLTDHMSEFPLLLTLSI